VADVDVDVEGGEPVDVVGGEMRFEREVELELGVA